MNTSKHTNPDHPGYFAQMVADSLNVFTKKRLATIHIRIPWYITPELLKHRQLSISSRSTRAVPVEIMLKQVLDDMVLPPSFGKNQRGMQAGEELLPVTVECLTTIIRNMGVGTASRVREMAKLGLHKQVCNKYLIPFLWCDLLLSSTTWANLLTLRTHPDAAPEMQIIGSLIADCLVESEPTTLKLGEWHMPYITPEDWESLQEFGVVPSGFIPKLGMVSAARCARISYKPFDSDVVDVDRDLQLALSLKSDTPVHAVPFEHVALCGYSGPGSGNFGHDSGWTQLRSRIKANVAKEFVWKGKIIL